MSGTVQSVERAAAMLQMLASQESLALAELATTVHLPKSTVHGLLRTLVDVGFVEQDPNTGKYQLAPVLFRLGSTRLDLNELRARAINWTDALTARSGESARVAAFRDGQAVLAHVVLSGAIDRATAQHGNASGQRRARSPGRAHDRSVSVGSQISLHANALGKTLLAFDPGAARSIRHVELHKLTHRTITERGAMQRELAVVRDLGFAVAAEEEAIGVVSIAAPIRDRGGYVVGAVGVEGPLRRLCDDRLRPRPNLIAEVQRAAHAISRELGHGRPG